MKAHHISLRLPVRRRGYRITAQSNLFKRIPEIVVREWTPPSVFVITDSTVERLYGRELLRGFTKCGVSPILMFFPDGERSKSFRTFHALHTGLLKNGVRRDSLIIALGGGVVGDVAGFVAATILRGVKFVQIPTTLLAQVDSSVGGKVGIDHPLGKNLIGAFHQPSAVFIDPDVLKTLPITVFRNGLAEIVKIAAALDPDLFSILERNAKRISKNNTPLLAQIIRCAVGLKAAVVENDERESGLRKVLNLGHTIGHALEAASGYKLRHGEAVSIGLVTELRIAQRLGLLADRDVQRIARLLREFRLPTRIPSEINVRKFFSAYSLDKKHEKGTRKVVLLNGIGRTAIGVAVPDSLVEQSIFSSNRFS